MCWLDGGQGGAIETGGSPNRALRVDEQIQALLGVYGNLAFLGSVKASRDAVRGGQVAEEHQARNKGLARRATKSGDRQDARAVDIVKTDIRALGMAACENDSSIGFDR